MTTTLAPEILASAPSLFERETIRIIDQFRTALIKVVDASIGAVRKSRDLQDRFGVNFTLSWQIYRILHSDNPLALSPHIPSTGMMKRLLAAARRHGAGTDLIAAVEVAHAAFEEHVNRYADDRTTFDSMVATLVGGEAEEQVEMIHRRALFDAHRYFSGIELDTFITTIIVGAADIERSRLDCVHVRAKRGLRRTNVRSPLIVDRRKIGRDMPEERGTVLPLDEDAFNRYGTSILPRFCSKTDLPLHRVETGDGTTTTEWIAESVGRPSAVDMSFGEIFRDVAMEKMADNQLGMSGTALFTTAARTSVHDFLVHRPTFGRIAHHVTRWGPALDFPQLPPPQTGLTQLPARESLSFIGSGVAAAHAVEMPEYVNLLQFACERVGWSLDEMDVYRLRMEYPLMHSLLSIELTFPGSQSWSVK